jgi:hypothetical protein
MQCWEFSFRWDGAWGRRPCLQGTAGHCVKAGAATKTGSLLWPALRIHARQVHILVAVGGLSSLGGSAIISACLCVVCSALGLLPLKYIGLHTVACSPMSISCSPKSLRSRLHTLLQAGLVILCAVGYYGYVLKLRLDGRVSACQEYDEV